MIAAVLDTNVLASGFIGEKDPGSTPGELVRRWRARTFRLVVSEHILGELANTFRNPYFTDRLTPMAIAAAFETLRGGATIQLITVDVAGVASHPEDDPILAAAVSAKVDCLVTGDKQLLERGVYAGVYLLSPRQFLAELSRQGDD